MKNNFYFVIIFSLILLPFWSYADHQQEIKDRMKSELDMINNVLEVGYAPKDWKENHFGWNLKLEIQNAKDKIQTASPISIKAYHKILKDFFQSAKDYHAKIVFHSTEMSSLPFHIKGANGKYFFTWIDTKRMPAERYPINIGDELLTFDGQSVDAVVQDIKAKETRNANHETDQTQAEMNLTSRKGRNGDLIPQGKAVITVKSSQTGRIASFEVEWDYKSEKIRNELQRAIKKNELPQHDEEGFLGVIMQFYHNYLFAPPLGSNVETEPPKDIMESRESYIPALGRIWWKSSPGSYLHAYLYENEDHHAVGYVRIPTYNFDDDVLVKVVKEFAAIIELFEERSDILIIDQINNPGGNIYFAYELASMLTNKPMTVPKERIPITPNHVAEAVHELEILDSLAEDAPLPKRLQDIYYGAGKPNKNEFIAGVKNFYRTFIETWNSGNALTPPIFYFDEIHPNKRIHYSKPILLLINGMDISSADFFAAVFQDNKRATLLGTHTAGAGGYVVRQTFPNLFGIDFFTYTGSIAERNNKNPLENIGVAPDIEYAITEEDLIHGFQPYADAINDAVKMLLKQHMDSQKSEQKAMGEEKMEQDRIRG